MKVAIYARVSTQDRDQDPATQLLPLVEHCDRHGWEVHRYYLDQASAVDLRRRTAWRELLDDAARRRFKTVLVFRLDRAFRSVKDMHDTLATWDPLGITFTSLREDFDTRTAVGRLMLNLLATMAEFELELIRERVVAGMDRAKKEGRHTGRPRLSDKRGFKNRFARILPLVLARDMSVGEAAEELGISPRSFRRYRAAAGR